MPREFQRAASTIVLALGSGGCSLILDFSDSKIPIDVPFYSLLRMKVETFPPDKLPPDLARIPAVKPGSK